MGSFKIYTPFVVFHFEGVCHQIFFYVYSDIVKALNLLCQIKNPHTETYVNCELDMTYNMVSYISQIYE